MAGRRIEGFIPDDVHAAEALLRTAWHVRAGELGAWMVHSSGFSFSGRAVIAFGQSGAGKSTLARLCSMRPDVMLLSDEINAILPGRTVYGTPFRSDPDMVGNPGPAKLATLLMLEKGSEERITPLSPAKALPKLLEQVYRVPELDPPFPEIVRQLLDLVKDVPFHVLTFRKEPAVGDFLADWLDRHPD